MIQTVEVLLRIQRDNVTKDKYFPTVVQASTKISYPFSIPTATIEIITNTEIATDGYVSPVRVDDIVTLFVSTKLNQNEKTVWETIFEGRVRDIASPFSNKNTSTLFCIGHASEASKSLIYMDISNDDLPSHDAGVILDYICWYSPALLTRIQHEDAMLEAGATIDYFNIKANQRYVADAFKDIEKLAKYHYYISIQCRYDTNGNLVAPFLRWKHFPILKTNKYAVIEGSERLLSAEFKSSAEELWNYIRVCGDKPFNETADTYSGEVTDNSVQYTGSAKSSLSIAKYGRRGKIMTVTGIESNYMCANIAAAMVVRFRNPIVSGSATLILTPNARIGDLVNVKMPSLEVNGEYLHRNYHVYSIEHQIGGGHCTTKLDFTKVKRKPEDYIADFAKQSQVAENNDVETNASTEAEQDGSAEYNVTSDTSDEGDSGYTDTGTWESDMADDEYSE